jgi:hypothetical protein
MFKADEAVVNDEAKKDVKVSSSGLGTATVRLMISDLGRLSFPFAPGRCNNGIN